VIKIVSQTTTNENMGKVITTLTVTNRLDQGKAEDGLIPLEQVRSVTLENVLVDTGATTLCLPPDVIAQLGLKLLKEVRVDTALGASSARIFQDAKISILGREGTFECLEVTSSKYPLLGVIPMEMLGIEVDLKNQRLIVLPDTTDDTYLTIL
jgi:clan AA aspartic protease